MVVCTMQNYTRVEQLKSVQATQIQNTARNVDNGNGAEEDEDREEGEIVDDFEMIISSEDEEFKLRARIQQLEDKSKDIEKMNMLAANLADQYSYQRPPILERYTVPNYHHFAPINILSDVSSLSEEEMKFEPPKKYRKHRTKRNESKRHNPTIKSRKNANAAHHITRSQSSHIRKKRRHENHVYHYSNSNNNNYNYHNDGGGILFDSLECVTDDEICEYGMNVEENGIDEYEERLKLSRNKLRMALARSDNYDDIKPKHSLRERLQYRMHKTPPSQDRKSIKAVEELPANSFLGYSKRRSSVEQEQEPDSEPDLEEPEIRLRLIALKSAMLKKHMARKKRDAERAYSPTDMINRVHQPKISDEIDDFMEISPAASPERAAYSPTPPPPPSLPARFAEPVDMELAQTDSEEDNNKKEWSQNYNSFPNSGGSWRCFMPNSLPPVSMPIVIDDDDEDEEQLQQQQQQQRLGNEHEKLNHNDDDDDDEIPPPAPSYHIPHMQLEDDDARDALHLHSEQLNQDTLSDIQSISMDNSQTQTQTSRPFQIESSDDEAAALRALLLARLKPAAAAASAPSKPLRNALSIVKEESIGNDSDDPEELRQLLLTSIASKKKSSPQDELPTEGPEILLNAVRRFQASSCVQEPELSPVHVQESLENLDAVPQPYIEPPQPVPAPALEFDPEPMPEPVPEPVPAPVLEPEPLPISLPLPVPPPEVVLEAPTPAAPSNIIKIVKPNKVINKKRKIVAKLPESEPAIKRPATLLVKEPIAPLHGQNGNSISSTRLITTMDPSSIKVKKLIIALEESSAGSDDELELSNSYTYNSLTSYADNASPFSQVIDSASNSTTRSNTPNSELLAETAAPSNPNLRRTVINEFFEKKLDDFLKQARSKVPTAQPIENSEPKLELEVEKSTDSQMPKTIAEQAASTPPKKKATPVAVRHLPVASQREYLRLIERMQLLEKKKIEALKSTTATAATATTTVAAVKETATATAKETTTNAKETTTTAAATKETTTTANTKNSSAEATAAALTVKKVAVVKATAVKKQMLKKVTFRAGSQLTTKPDPSTTNTAELPTTSIAAAAAASKATQPSKESRLKAFENSFHKIGCSMITNLDKSLQLVDEAKKSKIARLRYAQRLKELYAETQKIKQAVMLEEMKLKRIQPEIQTSHEIIISLKQKRNKLRNAAMDLGNGLKGDDYRLLDPGKTEIIGKYKQLTKDIRLYNSIVKYEHIPDADEVADAPAETETVAETGQNCDSRPERPSSNCDSQEIIKTETEQPNAFDKSVAVREEQTTLESVDNLPQIVPPPPFMRELTNPPAKQSLLEEYRTPMSRNYNSQLNINATICPFELMGRCEDTDCSYLHLRLPATQS